MAPIDWISNNEIPRSLTAVLAALRFDEPSSAALGRLSDDEWRDCLHACDRGRLTLLLAERAADLMPESVAERVAPDILNNQRRLRRLEDDYLRIALQLGSAGLDHVLLKGFAQEPAFAPDRSRRPQYDLDLYFRGASIHRARDVIADLGYESMPGQRTTNVDHLPAMVKPTGWHWQEDYFDADIPTIVELHFQLWDEPTERIPVPGIEDLWDRRTTRNLDGRSIPVFAPVDQLGYSALHVLRHMLRGDVRAYHVYELAYFLETHEEDYAFWGQWSDLHHAYFRALQCVPLLLARTWFGCRLPRVVSEHAALLPDSVHRWFDRYGTSLLSSTMRPNKDELWLHLSLLKRFPDRLRVAGRRLFPMTLPGPVDGVFVRPEEQSFKARMTKRARYFRHMAHRAGFHLRSLVSVVKNGFEWWFGR
jgi:hypothetical protein